MPILRILTSWQFWLVLLLVVTGLLVWRVSALSDSLNMTEKSLSAALTDCSTWRTKDSLTAAKNDILLMRIDQLERYRKEDYQIINSLKKRNEDLKILINKLSKTEIKIKTVVKDSIIYRDTAYLKYHTFKWRDNWTTVNGAILGDSVDLDVKVKDSLVIGVTTEYKRFLGFLWKTSKVKSQNIYATSKNPNCNIENIDCIFLKN